MTISDIYQQYPVHRGLQEHMIRVAAVAQHICEHMTEPVDQKSVVKACLVHDMGNLIKSKFDIRPDMFEPEGISHWETQKQAMIERYGKDVHSVTLQIVRELEISESVMTVIDEMAFERAHEIMTTGSVEVQLALYADMRVGIDGIVSLAERFTDIKRRYLAAGKLTEAEIDQRHTDMQALERQLFATCNITPEVITPESTKNIQANLWHYEL